MQLLAVAARKAPSTALYWIRPELSQSICFRARSYSSGLISKGPHSKTCAPKEAAKSKLSGRSRLTPGSANRLSTRMSPLLGSQAIRCPPALAPSRFTKVANVCEVRGPPRSGFMGEDTHEVARLVSLFLPVSERGRHRYRDASQEDIKRAPITCTHHRGS